MAVDIEPYSSSEDLPTDPVSIGARVQRIYDAVQAVERAGLNPAIYSNSANWFTIAGNAHPSFGCIPLWTPRYDSSADLASDFGAPWQPFGGWNQRAGKQYCENDTTCTVSIGAPDADLDVFSPTVFTGGTWGMALDESDANLGANVLVSRSGFRLNHATNQYVQTVTIMNTSTGTIPGPITLALDALSSNATLVNGNGNTSCTVPAGSMFINAQQAALVPGHSVTVTLQFNNPTNQGITYTPRVLAGAGTR
jgi:hypothetical protein